MRPAAWHGEANICLSRRTDGGRRAPTIQRAAETKAQLDASPGVDGNCCVSAGPVGSLGYLSQTLAITAGETLTISGLIGGNGSGEVHFYLNRVSVVDVYGPSNALSSYAVTALASGNDVFSVGFRDDPSYVQFDKLSVTDAADGAVPEPASWALMLGGFGLVGGAMRTRRNAVVRFGPIWQRRRADPRRRTTTG